MTNYKYLLSVVIPTKNRQEYAEKAIEQILNIESPLLQLVIQDNSDNNSLKDFIIKKSDSRLKYNYNSNVLSFVDNFSEAISLTDGEYVCMIGDDDGVLSQIIDMTSWAKANEVEAIIPTTNIVYVWPQQQKIIDNCKTGSLMMTYLSNKAYFCDPKSALYKLMSFGGQNYLSTDIVKLYHGVVKKECLNVVKEKTGHYFGGLSPDIYAAVSLSLVVNKAVRINYPITISGICNTSGSSDSATGKHVGKLEDAPHFRGHDSYDWSWQVPEFYSVETIWADSGLQAIKEMNAIEIEKCFNQSALDMFCLKKYSQFSDIIKRHMKNNNITNTKIQKEYVRLKLGWLIKRIYSRITRKKMDVLKDSDLPDILAAERKILENISKLNLNLDDTIKVLEQLKKEKNN